ncbi:TIGR02646 family protein [Vibrio owensii]|nr:TIGR02646 family protein [Vibrio owensii]
MKKIKKCDEPESLREYREANPQDDWKKGFKPNAGKQPNIDVRKALLNEQKGLCVYCEIDLKDGEGNAINDFRVEHFYPENPIEDDKRNDNVNYALHWPNMFGCCTGGSVRSVVDSAIRYTNPDFSCDVDKGNKDWTDRLLNPLVDIPAFPPIFEFNEDGNIGVKSDCPQEIKDKAEHSVHLLKLDSDRLIKFRKSIVDKLREQLDELVNSGPMELDDAMELLAESHLSEDSLGNYQAFFSTIRWYLGMDAEKHLTNIGYDG